MIIAVAYDENGEVFQHFGRTQNFKFYTVNEGKIVSSVIVPADGAGHEALAERLAEEGADVLLCGGLGDGAAAALEDEGITVVSGVSGNTDQAAEDYLAGRLSSAGVNCSHHEEDAGEDCGGHCGGCGGHCGGCGHHQIIMEGPNAGKTVRVHYKGTFDDGTVFDSSYDRGEPLEFVCGTGMMIRGFDAAVLTMEAGQSVDIHLEAKDAYGEADPAAVFTVRLSDLPGAENLSVGQHVFLSNSLGQSFPVVVKDKTGTEITFDANHEMAGKELNFHIELLEVQ